MPPESAPWILAAAFFNVALALFHALFWRIFGWPQTLGRSGPVNSGIAQVMNLALIFIFTVSGLICFLFPVDLAATSVGRFWLFSMAGFWLARALLQPIFFSFDHWLSPTLLAVFLLGAIVHAGAWYGSSGL
jgi:hypothetical protein